MNYDDATKFLFGMCKWDVYKDDGDLYSCFYRPHT